MLIQTHYASCLIILYPKFITSLIPVMENISYEVSPSHFCFESLTGSGFKPLVCEDSARKVNEMLKVREGVYTNLRVIYHTIN